MHKENEDCLEGEQRPCSRVFWPKSSVKKRRHRKLQEAEAWKPEVGKPVRVPSCAVAQDERLRFQEGSLKSSEREGRTREEKWLG